MIGIEENLIDLIHTKRKPIYLWIGLYYIYCFFVYHLPRFYNRNICRIKGCKVKGGYGGFNLPPEAYSYYCDRCGASESNYDFETDYPIIYKNGGF